MLPRCVHHVYSPSGDVKPSESCSVCTPMQPSQDMVEREEFDPFPHGNKTCPVCGSQKFKFDGNNGFDCEECGFSV